MIRSVVRVEFGVGIDPAIWTEVENPVEVVLTGGRADPWKGIPPAAGAAATRRTH